MKQVRLEEKLGKQGFQSDTKIGFKAITNAVTEANESSIEETKAIEELNESNVHVKTLELMNENWVIDTNLFRPLVTLLGQQNKSQFRLYGDTDGGNSKDDILNREEITRKRR